jgi:hypothetical protein
MNDVPALIRFDILGATHWALVVATASPDTCPFFALDRTTIIVDDLRY